MKNLRKIFAITFVILTVTLSMTACSDKGNSAKDDTAPKATETVSAVTEPETQPQTKTEAITVPPTEAVSEELTEDPTKAPVNIPAEVPEKAPVNVPAEVPTKAPVADNNTPDPTEGNKTDNVFFNQNNNYYIENEVNIRPRYLYWKDGCLFAECFVINGYDRPVSNIRVKDLTFTNASGEFASAAFGEIANTTLAPYEYKVHPFAFAPDCVRAYGADLSNINYSADTSFNLG